MRALKAMLAGLLLFCFSAPASAQEDCLECHETKDKITTKSGAVRSIFVDVEALESSPHADKQCIDCHPGAKLTVEIDLDMELEVNKPLHKTPVPKVSCGGCHKTQNFEYKKSAHGQSIASENPNAPNCAYCHSGHAIRKSADPESSTYRTKVPFLCGGCHSEGKYPHKGNEVSQESVRSNFPEEIHGESFFGKGLAVAATCTDCHGAHRQLKHTDPDSLISHKRIFNTCSRCHQKLESVHQDILEVSLWNTKPWVLPSCSVCHTPHEEKMKAHVAAGVSDDLCLGCHEGEGKAKQVDAKALEASVHTSISCAECHSDVNEKADERPCVKTGRVACANCHRGFGEQYTKSVHGKALAAGNMDAPYCSDCHGSHNIKFHMDPDSPTFKAEIPTLCGGCHGGEKPPEAISPKGAVAMADYSSSVHGLEVLRKGHMAPAVCIDCHSSHGMLDSSNPASSVHRDNLPATCGSCHEDVYRDFVSSVHYSHYDSEAKNFPACDDCHSSHKISKVTGPKFNMEINFQCGGCHENLAATYGDTIHGKIHKLGYEKAAKCSDCHGAHTILPPANPASSVAKGNLVRTCSKCHRKVTENFTGFMPHADYHSMEKRPVIYYTYWFMTLLLFGVFGFFGLHTLLWLPRALAEAVKAKRAGHAPTGRFVRRFELRHRVTHIFVIVSFLSLALTGMMLKYSYQPWAQTLADLLGGVSGAAFIHRVAAIVTFGYFFYHIRQLALMKRQSGLSWLGFTFRPESMMFNLNDIRTFWRNVKWFTWLGPRPEYGRFTYWEKFDYFAVFWGVPIIGLSGLVLWFPVFFTHWLPGWIINLAMIVHSDEALLAVGFIFTIHFFNTHLRPEAFPMDPVIFTGLAPEEKYMEERSEDYAAMKESGELDEVIVTEPLEPKWVRLAYIAGSVFLGLGIILIALILKTALGW